MKNEFTIKTTGSGTKEEIIKSLEALIETLEEQNENALVKVTFEDSVLCTEIAEA